MPAAPTTAPANNVNNGHPADKLGWAVAVGGLLNLPGGDQAGVNFAYSEGAAGYATNIGTGMQMYNASTSVGVGWLTDGVFDTGTEVQLTRVWSINATYQHIWNPKWKTSLFGGYVNVSYNDTAKNIINSHLPGASGHHASVRVPVAGAVFPPITMIGAWRGQHLQSRLQLLRNWHSHAVEPGAAARYRSRSALHAPQHRVQGRRDLLRRTAHDRRSRSSTTRTSGPRCSAGSATSIHDLLPDRGNLQRTPGGKPPGFLLSGWVACRQARAEHMASTRPNAGFPT